MNILLVNASPKGERSNTLHITHAFLDGLMSNGKHTLKTFMLKDKRIEFCTGCFYCWNNKDGKCVISDDMPEYTQLYKEADVVIFSTPVHFFGPSARLKNLFDRTLPFHVPEIIDRKDSGQRHEYRWDVGNKKIVLVATCGFYSYENNVEPLVKLFDICYGDNYEKIICPEGTLFSLEIFREFTQSYLDTARKAGVEMASRGRISDETREALIKRTFGKDDYIYLANNYWIQTDENTTPEEKLRIGVRQRTMQMSKMFNESLFPDEPVVVEMKFPELPYTCQLHLSRKGNQAVEDPERFLPHHLRLVLNPERFLAIASSRTNAKAGDKSNNVQMNIGKLTQIAVRLQKKGSSMEMKL